MYNPSTLAIVETWLSDDISRHYIYRDYQQFVYRETLLPASHLAEVLCYCFILITRSLIKLCLYSHTVNALAVIDSHDGHSWVLVYLQYGVSEDVNQWCS